ncbi:protein OXIDATIVE STRESS 3 LIKE 2 [Ricinus communis]|uniref:MTD1 n=1 Tax=Ricinus communis TaxID=3988 RepID=B9RQX9_RICCO|nr:protein OXIDATIVE STRESS 3 LIKE 2 [Ricinus communis]EEF46150.1 conserved hypothetical protein [Ricinus communis]|eukprot:XP_002516148.1 uncharacterized protein LOC8258595 [Ricinus communis]
MKMPWIFNSPSAEDECSSPTSSTTSCSSIGKNSDLWEGESSSDSEDCKEESEVQSVYKGKIDLLDALEDALPIRRGVSKFYSGRSKSFACVAGASSYSSIKDIAKPDNAYIRIRRSNLAFKLRHQGGISKRPIGSSPSALALGGVALSRSESIHSSTDSDSSSNFTFLLHPNSRSHLPSLQSLVPSRASHNNLCSLSSPSRGVTSRRSVSLPDFQRYAATESTK